MNSSGLPSSNGPEAATRESGAIWLIPETLKALHAMPSMFGAVDRNHRYLFANPALIESRKIGGGNVVGQTHWEVWPQMRGAVVEQAFDRAFSTGIAQRIEFLNDPGKQWLEIDLVPVGAMLHLYVRDITARKATEAEIERLMKSYASQVELLELAHDAIFVQRLDGTITFWNRSAERNYGWSRQEAIGQNVHVLLKTRGEVSIPEILAQMKETGSWEGDLIHTRRNGTELVVSSRWALHHTVPSEPPDVLEIVRDVTEQRRSMKLLEASQIALHEANDELEQRVADRTAELNVANQQLSTFTHHVSHDLRSPLRAILSTCHVIQEDYDREIPQGARELLDQQARAATKIGVLIDDLLELSRLGREEIQHSQVDLTTLARVCAGDAAKQYSSQNVQFEAEAGLEADADPRLISLAIQNLIDNAFKYSPKGGLVKFGRSGPNEFFVSDEGIGIDLKYSSIIFEPLQRLHGEDVFPGSGIGLSNVKQVIERHGGQIWVESEPGKGSTFFFTLGGPS